MKDEKPFLVINSLSVNEEEIMVGCTDNKRWESDLKRGDSGADAYTFVYVVKRKNEKGDFISLDEIGIHLHPTDSLRNLAIEAIPKLLEIIWEIINQKMDFEQADARYFGMSILKEKKKNLGKGF